MDLIVSIIFQLLFCVISHGNNHLTKILGKWKSMTYGDVETLTNERSVETYEAGGKGFISSCNAHPVTNADGSYTYYIKSGGNWVVSANVDNEYLVDGDWLATRWRSEAGAKFSYEWWDIDYIRGDEMKWSALREDVNTHSRFRTTFTWKRVK